MSVGSKSFCFLSVIFCAVLMSLCDSVTAGTFSASTNAPVVDEGDVAFLSSSNTDTIKSYTDAGAVGTTFTVGSKPILVDAVSFYSSTATLASRNNTYEVRVATITGGTNISVLGSTAGILQDVDTVAPSWFTWTLDTIVALDANTTYAVDVRMTASGGWSSNIPYYYRDKDQLYTDGQHYTAKNSPYNVAAFQTRDLLFHVNAQFPPPAGTLVMIR